MTMAPGSMPPGAFGSVAPGTMPMGSIPAPPQSRGPAMVPVASGAHMPRVSYRVLDEDEAKELEEDPLPKDRDELIRYCQRQDEEIEELKMKAKQLRAQTHGDHDDWVKRLEQLEAHVLSSKLRPVKHGKDALNEPAPPPQDLPPNGLLQEMAERRYADEVFEDMTPWEEHKMFEQMDLNMESMRLGLPTIQQMGLPEGSEIVDIRLVEGWYLRQFLRSSFKQMQQMSTMGPGGPMTNPIKPPPPTMLGRVHDSNYMLTPSPLHPVGPVSQMGLLKNLYPIDRAPIDYENVFQTSWPGQEQMWYQGYGDMFDGRKFPQKFAEVSYERDVDKGRTVRNVQWRSQPSGERVASVGVDVDGDGFADITVVGKDKNMDGIPDILQVNPMWLLAQNACSKVFRY